jgi:hypothetical protein
MRRRLFSDGTESIQYSGLFLLRTVRYIPPFWVGACLVRHKLSLYTLHYQLYQCMSLPDSMSPPDSITTTATALHLHDLSAAAVVPR